MDDAALWLAIYDLYVLLLLRINGEAAYQNYFERHPIVFLVLGYDRAVPFDKDTAISLPFDAERLRSRAGLSMRTTPTR